MNLPQNRVFSSLRKAAVRILKLLQLDKILRDALRDFKEKRQGSATVKDWYSKGCPTPPPDTIKRGHIRKTAQRHGLEVLVETGTFYGGTMFALRNDFKELHSVELFAEKHEYVSRELAHLLHIHLHLGDSSVVLPAIISKLEKPALFWLDGHYMGEGTGLGDKETPILEELDAIMASPIEDHVILVDDARLFNGTNDYPTPQELEKYIRSTWPQAQIDLQDDIFFIRQSPA